MSLHAHDAIHVMHARALMTAGLAAVLQSDGGRVTRHDECPGALATAGIVVTGYEDALELARTPLPGRRQRRLLVVTHLDKEREVRRALDAGVAGYLLDTTDAAQLRHAVQAIGSGTRYVCPSVLARLHAGIPGNRLTSRENDVLALLAQGLCNKRIARDLGIGVGTVKWHLHSLMAKLGASKRTEAVIVAAQRGLVGI